MLYDHRETLMTVAPEDVAHVEKMLAKLDAYARSDGRAPLGAFLAAVVVGDLLEAVTRADDINMKYIRELALYTYNCLPGTHVLLARPVLRIIIGAMWRDAALNRSMVENTTPEFSEAILKCVVKQEREERSNAGRENA